MFIDTHCHFDFPCFDADRKEIIQHCLAKKIKYFIVPSVQQNAWKKTLSLVNNNSLDQNAKIIIALGLHPYFISAHKKTDLDELEEYCDKKIIPAIGEIGLDYYLKDLDVKKQLYFFQAQISLAKKYQLPIIVHARKSHHQLIELIKKTKVESGIIHAFNGSLEQGREYIKQGFKLGFGGAFSYQKATKIRQLVRDLPLSSMVLETDSPDMIPQFSQFKRNTPESIIGLFKQFVELRTESADEIQHQLILNAQDIFPQINFKKDKQK